MRKIILLLTWICLASCTSDSLLDEQRGTPLEIQVDVVAYNQDVDDVSTRASVNNGVITTFAPGDDLGLFVVDKSSGELVANNYRYVVQKTGNAYRVDEGGNVIASDIYYNENYTYFAYAPYNSVYDGYQSIESIIAKHTEDFSSLYEDQSTQTVYNAADLLVCQEAIPSGTTLRIRFTHAMSLMKIFYNGDLSELAVEQPVDLSKMYKPDGNQAYSYLYPPSNNVEVYGTIHSKQTVEEENEQSTAIDTYSYWQTYVNLKKNGMLYISIYSQPLVSYKSVGVDMGFPSGCIWANRNLHSETASEQKERGGKWYDADGNVREDLMESDLHSSFDRGGYFSWGELDEKYEQPALLFNDKGRISATGDAIVTSSGVKSVTPLISGSKKGYYPETYIDRNYTMAEIDGNIAGTEYDVVRNKLWKGEWRIPNEHEVDELMRNSTIEIYDWYYEDNVRYAPWLAEKDNLHPDNSEFYGTDDVRPYRYMVCIFKFTSKLNGEVLYIPGGTWSDWSIDMLACYSRDKFGLRSSNTTGYSDDYGGIYYFASSASHSQVDCSSYMEVETRKTVDATTGKITKVEPVMKTSSYFDKTTGEKITLMGLTQNGHRYTGMLIRPVYGGKNWNTNTKTRSKIRINVEER